MKKYIPILLAASLLLSACGVNQLSDKDDIGDKMASSKIGDLKVSSENNSSNDTNNQVAQGDDLKISQTNEETQLLYKGEVIKTWSHTPPEKNPFIWDDACTRVWEQLEKIKPEDDVNQKKQQIWNSLTLSEKKDCLKESLMSSIKFTKIDNRFIQVQQYGYEGFLGWWIYDTQSGNIQEIMGADGMIKSIEVSNERIKIEIENARGEAQFTILQFDVNFESLISKKEV